MKKALIIFSFCIFICNTCFTQIRMDTTVVVKTINSTYQTDDLISVMLTGTIASTGDCDGGPMWGLVVKKDSTWITLYDMQGNYTCGLPWVNGQNSVLKLFTIGAYNYNLLPGTYKLLFMNPRGRIVETNEFIVTDALWSNKLQYKKTDTISINFQCQKQLGVLYSSCTGFFYDLEVKTNQGWTSLGIAFPCPAIYEIHEYFLDKGKILIAPKSPGEYRIKVIKLITPVEVKNMFKRNLKTEKDWYSNSFFIS